MSSEAITSGIEVDEEVEDNWQRRKYLKEIYDSHHTARQALLELSNNDTPRNRRFAMSTVSDLVQLCRPMVKGTELWDETKLCVIELVPDGEDRTQQYCVTGLKEFLSLKRGYQTLQHREAAGKTGATQKVKKTQFLPPHAIENVLDSLTDFLYNRDILMDKSGENEAKDTKVL